MSTLNPVWKVTEPSRLRACGAVLALTLSAIGCSQGPLCQELASCGGNPKDKWAGLPRSKETPGTYCQEAMYTPPVESHLKDQNLPVARQRLPEKTTADWCSELVVTGDMIEAVKKHNYWWQNLPYFAGFLEYQPAGTYQANLTRKGKVDRWFSQSCLRKYGYSGDCKQFQADFERANQGAGEYNTFNRGPRGGWTLGRPAAEITVADVIRVLDGPLASVRGIRPHELADDGVAEPMIALWVAVRASLRSVLDHVTIADLASGTLPPEAAGLLESPGAWSAP